MGSSVKESGFSRRAMLRGGLASVVLVGLGGVGLALQSSKRRVLPSGGLVVFSPDQYAILAAFASRICPEASSGVPGADAIDVAGQADRLLARAEKDAQEGVKAALAIVESGLTGALFFERTRPFTQLSPTEQDGVVEAFRTSKVGARRTIHRALCSLCSSIYYGDPRVWPSIGYDGPPDPRALRAAYAENLVDLRALEATGAAR